MRQSLWNRTIHLLCVLRHSFVIRFSDFHITPPQVGPAEIVVIAILFTGVLVIPITVHKFRSNFRPLLDEYRINVTLDRLTLDAIESGTGRATERRSKVDEYRTD